MVELLNLADMPWWAWLAWWVGMFAILMQAEKRRVVSVDAVAAGIISTFLASILMMTHGAARALFCNRALSRACCSSSSGLGKAPSALVGD